MKAIINSRQEIAQGIMQVEFGRLDEVAVFRPGQFIFITLDNPPYTDNRGNKRHFSIINPQSQKQLIAVATKIGPSAFKRSLFKLPLKTPVELGPIRGNFILPEETSFSLVFIAGGIGITPFLSMLRTINDTGFKQEITLFHSNRDKVSTPFFDELSELAKKEPKFKYIPIMTRDEKWLGEKRRINGELLKDYLKDLKNYRYFLAGPTTMVGEIYQALLKTDIPLDNIKSENFSGY